jgi:hypothetical protein
MGESGFFHHLRASLHPAIPAFGKQPGASGPASGLERLRARLIWDWSGGRRQIRGRATIRQTGAALRFFKKAGQVERLKGARKWRAWRR